MSVLHQLTSCIPTLKYIVIVVPIMYIVHRAAFNFLSYLTQTMHALMTVIIIIFINILII